MWKKKMLKKCKANSLTDEQATPFYSKEATNLFKTAKKSVEVETFRAHNYVCGVCKFPFPLCDNFATHLQTHDYDTSLECSTCTELLNNKKEYYKHLIIHAKKSLKFCNTCAKTYITWLRLKCHLDWHDKLFRCHLCNEAFVKSDHLEKHLLVHTLEEYRTCKICNELESQNSCVQMAFHSKQSQTCGTCGKVFDRKQSLSAHQRMHRFSCQFCTKMFRMRVDLMCHLRCDHPEVSLQTKLTSHLNDSRPESPIHIDLTSHPNASDLGASGETGLTSHLNDYRPESPIHVDLISHPNASDLRASGKTDLTSHFNGSYPEASHEMDSTGLFAISDLVAPDKIDLTKNLKVLIQRLPSKITSYLNNSTRDYSFKANASNSAS